MTELDVPVSIPREGEEGGVRPERSAFLLSAAAHATLVLLLVWTGAFAPRGRGPVQVDLVSPEDAAVILPAADSRSGGPPAPSGPSASAPIRGSGFPVPASPRAVSAAAPAVPSGAEAIPGPAAPVDAPQESDSAVASPAPQAAAPVPVPEGGSPGVSPARGVRPAGDAGKTPTAGGDPSASGASADAGAPSAGGPGLPVAPGSAWAHGMGPLFHHIRESIQKALSYPATARRMGWQGQVLVTFTVLADGRVRDLHVVRSSGYPLLDRSALDAIWSAQPFRPRPPFEARIVTPVVYSIN